MKVFLISILYVVYVKAAVINPYEDPYYEEIPYCNTHKEACDVSLIFNGVPRASSQQSCRCRGDVMCGGDQSRTISRVLSVRAGHSMVMQMSYCDPIGNERTCVGDEVATVMEGAGGVVTTIVRSDCRCPAGQPLLLHRTYHPRNTYKIHNEFVCNKEVCPIVSNENRRPCKTTTRQSTRFGNKHSTVFTCKCPDGFTCSMDYSPSQRINHGYCQRM